MLGPAGRQPGRAAPDRRKVLAWPSGPSVQVSVAPAGLGGALSTVTIQAQQCLEGMWSVSRVGGLLPASCLVSALGGRESASWTPRHGVGSVSEWVPSWGCMSTFHWLCWGCGHWSEPPDGPQAHVQFYARLPVGCALSCPPGALHPPRAHPVPAGVIGWGGLSHFLDHLCHRGPMSSWDEVRSSSSSGVGGKGGTSWCGGSQWPLPLRALLPAVSGCPRGTQAAGRTGDEEPGVLGGRCRPPPPPRACSQRPLFSVDCRVLPSQDSPALAQRIVTTVWPLWGQPWAPVGAVGAVGTTGQGPMPASAPQSGEKPALEGELCRWGPLLSVCCVPQSAL